MGEQQQQSWLWKKGGVGGLSRRVRRVHGLQSPLHPQQVLGWVLEALIVAFMYGAVVPALHSNLVPPVAAASATLFLAHIVAHVTALVLDPAHPLLRTRQDKRLIPEFDRSLHSHVIENGRCHLCNITIASVRTKHCSACNKCVDVFDHHCKWLNNCIGRRNYRVFLVTVITAVLSCLMVMATCLSEIILYYFNRQYLAPWENGIPTIPPFDEDAPLEDTNHLTCKVGSPYCHFSVFGAKVYDGAFIGLLSTLFSIALIAGVLLIHLVAFHVYLLLLGLTTYEYIRGTSVSGHGNSYGGRIDPNHDGTTCGWGINPRHGNNQITPSSTTDTALLASPDPPSTTTTSPGTLSPRSNPSTPADDTRHLLGGRHLMVHHKQGSTTHHLASRSGYSHSTSRASSVPSLPKINGTQRTPLRTVSKSVSSGNINNSSIDGNTKSSDDSDLSVHLVTIPRPPRVIRRRMRSSVVPHLSPIKECDIASSSPPSLRNSKEFDSNNTSCVFAKSSSKVSSSLDTTTTAVTILKHSSRSSPRPIRARPSRGRTYTVSPSAGDLIVTVTNREKASFKSSPKVPSLYRKQQPRGVLSNRYANSSSAISSSSSPRHAKLEKSLTRPLSAPAQVHIIKKSSSFNGTTRLGTPTLRFKVTSNKESNGHATRCAETIASNSSLVSIVRSSSDGLLIKMGEVTRGGVYIGPHNAEQLPTNSLSRRTAKTFVEHHM